MFFHSEKRFEIYKKKHFLQNILTIFAINFFQVSQHFEIMYVLLNIQVQLKKLKQISTGFISDYENIGSVL